MSGLLNPFATELVLAEVRAERERQDQKWGEQNHPDGTGPHTVPLAYFDGAMSAEELSDAARDLTDEALGLRMVQFRDILLEELFEALAESDPRALRRELVQVAAVATQWVEAIDRRRQVGHLHAVESEVTYLPEAGVVLDRTDAGDGRVAGLSPARRQGNTRGGAS